MPAASDAGAAAVALPKIWRPMGVRLAVVFFGAMLAVVFVMAWLGFDQQTRDTYTPFQIGTLGVMVLGGAGVGYAVARSSIRATDAGLVVVNGFRKHSVGWDEVASIRLPSGAPWARLRLKDGRVLSVTALQGSDGRRATVAVEQLQALIAAR